MRLKIYLLLFSLALLGCNKSNDDHVFTLYSSYKNNRLHVATFDAAPISWNDKNHDGELKEISSELNFKECGKVANLLENEWLNTVKNNDIKYWCEKGRYRK